MLARQALYHLSHSANPKINHYYNQKAGYDIARVWGLEAELCIQIQELTD
jgi:hypothetical protein